MKSKYKLIMEIGDSTSGMDLREIEHIEPVTDNHRSTGNPGFAVRLKSGTRIDSSNTDEDKEIARRCMNLLHKQIFEAWLNAK